MSTYKVSSMLGRDFFINALGEELLVKEPESKPGILHFSMNGDELTIDLQKAEAVYDPLVPGSLSSSRISLRMNMWVGKGLMIPKITTPC